MRPPQPSPTSVNNYLSTGTRTELISEFDRHSPVSAETELELLKAQVQDIARVCKAVALGDLTQKIIVPVKGQEMVELKGKRMRPRGVVYHANDTFTP